MGHVARLLRAGRGGPGWESSDTTTDEATNGLDDDGAHGIDDPGERETAPPYPFPLRGIQIRIRAMEPDSRQIRQVTMVADFVPG